MTYADKQKVLEMRLEGYTIQDIADEFGVSKQNISQFLNTLCKEKRRYKRCNCIYPGLREWLAKPSSPASSK